MFLYCGVISQVISALGSDEFITSHTCFKRSPFSILDKDKREMDYIKGVYKKKIQAEIESYKDLEDENKRDTIQAQDVLMLDKISI